MAAPGAAAAATAWHTYLTGELGFTNTAATHIETDQAYTGLDTLALLVQKDITNLVDSMKKGRGVNAILVSQAAERGLLNTLGYVNGCLYTSRPYTLAECTRAVRDEWGKFWTARNNYKEPTEVPDCTSYPANWVQGFEQLDEYFRTMVGDTNKVPLYYVVRAKAEVKPHADDPATNYASRWDEMCARMPHTRILPGATVPTNMPDFEEDNRKVWNKLVAIFKNSKSYSHIKPFARQSDGRAAYRALYNVRLGPNNMKEIATNADAEMAKLRYTGEKRRHNFESYINAHKHLHNVYNDIKELGHEGISESTKVRKFIQGIHHPDLKFLQGQVLMNDQLSEDFEKTCVLYRTYISQNGGMSNFPDQGTQIGAVQTGKRKYEPNWDTNDVEVELRYYPAHEYRKLSSPQKQKLKRLRAGGIDPKEAHRTMRNPNDPLMKKAITAMSAKASNKKGGRGGPAPKGKPKSALKPGNRHNKALVKQVTIDDDNSEA